ncbi:hypothetical protein [Pseudomonas frederiksbergensis]|uniref:HEAT repeat domain-containing protein n=1 Tax=Pseudomonas frederiksbergensis TaxID=104087 RepID=A0A423HK13_9PSED|nr:hypothetical protein [Pseudomonas frederiksbergensis]RON13541.1 hypothetical protein BK662_20530 [Pseudomonas frederiksbergensis]RON13844.1 hypothetical protein BK662_22165 [Pseudomonas frederiksbergensis]
MSLLYQDPTMSHEEATRLLASDLETNVAAALISIGLNEQDRVWAQNTCLKYLEGESESVAAAAITALGHIARRQGGLDLGAVRPALEKVKERFPSLEGTVADTLDDIEAYT